MKKSISILTLLLLSLNAQSEPKLERGELKYSFQLSECAENFDLEQNGDKLSEISSFIKSLQADESKLIQLIEINSYTSPIIEANTSLKYELKSEREMIKNYLIEENQINESIIITNQKEIDWSLLRTLVESSDIPYRNEVLYTISEEGDKRWCRENPGDCWYPKDLIRTTQLKSLQKGIPYKYMERNLFDQLNRTIVTVWYQDGGQKLSRDFLVDGISTPKPVIKETVAQPKPVKVKEPKPVKIKEPKPIKSLEETPLFALKTNLLFDALSFINIEAEVPIGEHFSVAGEWVFPWWISDNGRENSKRNRTQLLHGNVEGKYWFGDRTNRPQLTGWFAGLYAGGGSFDFERKREGYQGEFFIAAGVSGGYAHTINKNGNLRMEYSLGLGYLKTDYREYEAFFGVDDKWHPIRRKTGNYTWVGPTKAKVSLVWMFNKNSKRGGVR